MEIRFPEIHPVGPSQSDTGFSHQTAADQCVAEGHSCAGDNTLPDRWQPEIKVDAVKLVQGNLPSRQTLVQQECCMRSAQVALYHAWIKKIDTSKAKALPGVAAVLIWKDIPRVVYSTAGQSDPIPGPLDSFSLDNKVRFVGDRVAFVAAESPEIAEKACKLIEVEYDVLEPILEPAKALNNQINRIHDEPEFVNFAGSDPTRNLAAEIRIDIGTWKRFQ
jgi:putative selenate reductase molybdopterin-binding subunit